MTMYGHRALKITEGNCVWYVPFDGAVCRDMLMSIRVDVGSADAYSEAKTMEVLGSLYQSGAIDRKQYLSRLPKGTVPRLDSLLQELG